MKTEEELLIELDEYPTFNLENAVCNHGFFMMAPNIWDSSTRSLKRPLRLSDSITCVDVTISQLSLSGKNHLLIKLDTPPIISNSMDKEAILGQVRRMLRLTSKDEMDVQQFHGLHPEAKEKGFGRIFRSPSFFEDAVKCFLLCFCTIQKSLEMARLLCEMQSKLMSKKCTVNGKRRNKKRKIDGSDDDSCGGDFPNAKELASFDLNTLVSYCKLGLRATNILEFAKGVDSGKYKLSKFEDYNNTTSEKELLQKLMKIKGFGCYASTNALMCLGFYQNVPIDSETKRHLIEIHGRKVSDKNNTHGRRRKKNKVSCKNNIQSIIKEVYEKYAPFQCLAFWFELAAYYEAQFGKLSDLPSSIYGTISGSPKKKHIC